MAIRTWRRAAAVLALVVAQSVPTGSRAAVGDLVATVRFGQACASGLGVGIAFDGTHLWYSCYRSSPDLIRATPDGTVVASYDVAGGLGALAYDATRNAIWAGWGNSSGPAVRLVQLDASKAVVSSSVQFYAYAVNDWTGLDDGLAFDAADESLYITPDVSYSVHRYTTNGAYLGSFSWGGNGCYNSGVAVGGDVLYEGADGCAHVYAVSKSSPSTHLFDFSTAIPGDSNFRDEDLECDASTFAAQGKHVMWSMEAYEPRRAAAFEIAFGSCGSGGLPPAPPSPQNQPPVPKCHDVVVTADAACAGCASIDAGSYDPDGDPIQVTLSPSCPYPLGSTLVTLAVDDGKNPPSTCTAAVTVVDRTPPEVVAAPPISLWPPDHKLRSAKLSECAVVKDNCSGSVNVDARGAIATISSDELPDVTRGGDGRTVGDIQLLGASSFALRRERQGGGNGRVYTVTFSVADDAGNATTAQCQYGVPHDFPGAPPIDDGPAYTVP